MVKALNVGSRPWLFLVLLIEKDSVRLIKIPHPIINVRLYRSSIRHTVIHATRAKNDQALSYAMWNLVENQKSRTITTNKVLPGIVAQLNVCGYSFSG